MAAMSQTPPHIPALDPNVAAARGFREPGDRPKRFWKTVTVERDGDGWGVRLDGRAPKTPAGAPLVLPTEAAARLAAEEWAAQGEVIEPAAMPATRLAATAIDRVARARTEVAEEIARYAGSDLLCYFAEAPAELAARQARAWGPWLDWAERALDLRLVRAAGIVHAPQPPEAAARVRELALGLDDFGLAGLALAASLLGSAVLALALQRGALGGGEAFDLSRLDEAFQEGQWGVDAEAAERAARMRAEAELLQRWFEALKG